MKSTCRVNLATDAETIRLLVTGGKSEVIVGWSFPSAIWKVVFWPSLRLFQVRPRYHLLAI